MSSNDPIESAFEDMGKETKIGVTYHFHIYIVEPGEKYKSPEGKTRSQANIRL